MKRILTSLSIFSLLFLFSCQKESDFTDPGNSGNNNSGMGSKLVRIGSRFGTDSITIDFSYDNSNLLSTISYSGNVSGVPFTLQVRIIRNSSKIITSTITKSSVYASNGIDSVINNCVYDVVNSRYKYSVVNYKQFGIPGSDSLVYSYATNGKLVCGIGFLNDGSGYELDTKDSIYYSGNNISSTKSYSYNGTGFDLDEVTDYLQYDSKANPLQFTTDAPILGMTTYYSANNVIRRTITDYTTGNSGTGTFTYTYNSNNRPVKIVSTDGTQTSISTYYYQ